MISHYENPCRGKAFEQWLILDRLTIAAVDGDKLLGHGWDALADKEVPFEVDLQTGKHKGGANPSAASRQ